MINLDKWVLVLALWLASAGTALAHPPYIEPWMHSANISISVVLGITVCIVVRKKMGLLVAIAIGVCLSLISSVAGLLISIYKSM